MIQLRRPDEHIRWPEDVARLRRILNAAGYDASDSDIQWAYETWSEDEYCAGWMHMGDLLDDTLLQIILGVLTPPADAPPHDEKDSPDTY